MKRCCSCKQELELSEFNKNKGRKDGLNSICKECSRVRSKKYYKDNPTKHKINTSLRNRQIRDSLLEKTNNLKLSAGCKFCIEKEVVCLDFHHLDANEKEFSIAKMVSNGRKWQEIENEIAKCIIVCSNCHRKLHAGILKP